MMNFLFPSVLEIGKKIVGHFFPNSAEKQAKELELIEFLASQEGNAVMKQLELALEDSRSGDKFRSRARPLFLYVMYFLLCCSIPISLMGAIYPAFMGSFLDALGGFFRAIPGDLYALLGACFGFYSTGRTLEKIKGKTT